MDLLTGALIVVGLVVFETISSIDNAIINADVLATMGQRARRWFLIWGLLFAVFVIRGVLPWLIVWIATPGLGPIEALTATFSEDPRVIAAIEESAPIMLTGGGTFLVFLFLHWLFLEPKHFGLRGERIIIRKGIWFYAVASIVLLVIVWICIQTNPMMAFAAVVGSTGFFIVSGFRTNAEQAEQQLVEGKTSLSDWSKILYLEIIDATFSIDGVIGAFAFTLSVPLILLGNGIGAFVVREVTIRHVDQVKKYPFLKNGAMYSIAFLGMIMLMDGFGFHIPPWVSPIFTISIVVFFLVRSIRYNGMAQVNDPAAAFPDLFSIADEPSPENGLIPDRNDK